MRGTLYRADCNGPASGKGIARGPGLFTRRFPTWAAGVTCFFCFLLFPFFCSYGAQHVVLYQVGERDPAAMSMMRRHFAAKGFVVSVFDGTDSIEKQVELANRINRLRASVFIAIDFSFAGEETEEAVVTVAVTDVKRKSDRVLAIEDVPGAHAASSKEFAALVAGAFNRKVLELPLFPLVGIDMPGIFLRIECSKDEAGEILEKLSESMQKFFGKGKKK